MTEFRGILNKLEVDTNNRSRLCNSLTKYLNTVTRDRYALFAPTDVGTRLGKAIYDKDKFTTYSLVFIFRMKKDKWKGHRDLQQLIKDQASKFSSKNFNYTQILSNKGHIELDSYFDEELYLT